MRRSLLIVFFAAAMTSGLGQRPATTLYAEDAGRSEKSAWTTDDVVLAEQAGGFEISPDDRWIVWVKSTPDTQKDRLTTNIILSSLTESKQVELTRGVDNALSLIHI